MRRSVRETMLRDSQKMRRGCLERGRHISFSEMKGRKMLQELKG